MSTLCSSLRVTSFYNRATFLSTVTHSLQYLHMASWGISGFPEFVTVVLVDHQPFSYYDSNIRRELPRQSWMLQSEDPDFWERRTRSSSVDEQVFRSKVAVIKPRFNQTGGELWLVPHPMTYFDLQTVKVASLGKGSLLHI